MTMSDVLISDNYASISLIFSVLMPQIPETVCVAWQMTLPNVMLIRE